MWFKVSELQGVTVFKLFGYLKGHPDSYRFLGRVREELEKQDRTKVAIDLGGVKKIDSAGVGVLAAIVTAAEVAGASLVFSNIAKRVEKPIVIVRLMRILNVVPALDDAVKSLAGQAVF